MKKLHDEQKKKKIRPRRSDVKKNPKMSSWWTDYVTDKRRFRDVDLRDGRLITVTYHSHLQLSKNWY